MRGELDRPDFSCSIEPHNFESSSADAISIRWVETVVAHELLSHLVFLIDLIG